MISTDSGNDNTNWKVSGETVIENGRWKITARWEFVTPSMAKDWLLNRPKNRKIKDDRVDLLVRAILRGAFVPNGETLIFDSDDQLRDGQHRLKAIMKSNIPQFVLVVRGINAEWFSDIDCTPGRTVRDVFQIDGRKRAEVLAAACNLVHCYLSGKILRTQRTGMSPSEARVFLMEHESINDGIDIASQCNNCLPIGMGTGLYYLFKQVSPMKAGDFFDALGTGLNLHRASSVYWLRERLIRDRQNRKSKMTPREVIALTIKAFNAYISDRDVKSLRWNEQSGETFPTIDGFEPGVAA